MRKSELISLAALATIGVAALGVGRYVATELERVQIDRAEAELDTIGFADLEVDADGLVLAVSGRVRSRAERAAVADRLAAMDGVDSVIDNVVVVTPLVDLRPAALYVQKDDEALTLTGEAPNDAARDLLGARAKLANPNAAFLNLMKAQDRRPMDDWFSAAEAAIDAVSALNVGRAAVERDIVRIEGAVSDAELRVAVEQRLRDALGPSFALEVNIKSPPPLLAPYRFAARTGSDGVVIEVCAAPDAAIRAVILGAYRSTTGAVADQIDGDLCQIANGAPNDAWGDAVARALEALEPFEEGEVTLVDDRVRIAGFVPKEVNLENLRLAASGGWPDLYGVDVDIRETLPVASPFALTAVKRPGDARLTGHAPTIERAEAWAVALDATNETELARGAPPGWVRAADAALSALVDLKVGAVTLSDRTVVVAAPGDPSSRAQLRDRLRAAIPAGYRVDVVEARQPDARADDAEAIDPLAIDRSSFKFAARRDTDDTVRIGGVVGDETSRAVVSAYAKAKLGGVDLSEALAVGEDAPPAGWQRAIFAGIEALSELESGEMTAEDGAIFLRGQVSNGPALKRALAYLNEKTPSEYTRFSRVRMVEVAAQDPNAPAGPPLAPDACVEALNAVVAEEPIVFASGSSTIEGASNDALDALTAVLSRCPETRVEIGGHTDSAGGEEENKALSQRRAAAVRLSLAARGADRRTLTAVGYGEASPVADNDTAEGRARNRRIEFKRPGV